MTAVKNRCKQIRRANLRIWAELDNTRLTITELAELLGIRREGLSRKLGKALPDAEQERIISVIRTANRSQDTNTN
ncbi:MAG: hypothetical protein IJJ29_12395 [Solobacterium sp.]|nr:hypothetical protein [Solobacterium sp.]